MRKTILVLASAAAALSLAGCSDAQAKLSDSSTTVVTIGDQSITKGDIYSLMVSTSGAGTVINDANKVISNEEVDVTDEMRATAESTLNEYKSMYGDSFIEYLEGNGLTEEEYVEQYLIPSLQAEQLTDKYIEAKWDTLIETYTPRKTTIISFESEDDANAALAELNDGSKDASTAASDHNGTTDGTEVITTESTDIDSMVRTVVFSGSPDDGWTELPSSDGGTYYVVKIEDDDPNNFKDEAVTALESIDEVSDNSTTYFFKKYGFHVYDITIYNAIAADYSQNLVQDMTDDDPLTSVTDSDTDSSSESTASTEASSTPEPSASASASASAAATTSAAAE